MKIILIHGQGRTPNAMRPLGFRLKRLGYSVDYFRYYAYKEKVGEIVARLSVYLNGQDESYAVVGHSMGGVLTRVCLPLVSKNPPVHLILLASPTRAPAMWSMLNRNPLYKLFTFDCGQKVGDPHFYETIEPVKIPVTVISGTAGPRWKNSPLKGQDNDSVLSVNETKLDGAEHVQVNALHTFIMNSREVCRYIDQALKKTSRE